MRQPHANSPFYYQKKTRRAEYGPDAPGVLDLMRLLHQQDYYRKPRQAAELARKTLVITAAFRDELASLEQHQRDNIRAQLDWLKQAGFNFLEPDIDEMVKWPKNDYRRQNVAYLYPTQQADEINADQRLILTLENFREGIATLDPWADILLPSLQQHSDPVDIEAIHGDGKSGDRLAGSDKVQQHLAKPGNIPYHLEACPVLTSDNL